MSYAAYRASDAYTSKVAGASVEILILNADDPSEVIIGRTTGMNSNEDFETLPVEEAGESGVNEIVDGRHTITGNLPAFYSPQWNDRLPTRQNFIAKRYTIMKRIGEDWPHAGTVLDVVTGCKLSRLGNQQGARGLITLDMAFTGERRYNGGEWEALTGGS